MALAGGGHSGLPRLRSRLAALLTASGSCAEEIAAPPSLAAARVCAPAERTHCLGSGHHERRRGWCHEAALHAVDRRVSGGGCGSGGTRRSRAVGVAERSFAAPSDPCRLQEAYLDALERCGGLHEARPKALLDMLQPRFPYLTLQVRGRGSGWMGGGGPWATPEVTGRSRRHRRQSFAALTLNLRTCCASDGCGMAPRCSESTLHVLPASQRSAGARQVPTFCCRSAHHVQNVKNHLQKQRTKEAKAAAGGRRNSASRRSEGEEEDLDDADPMDSGEGPMSGGGAGPAPPRGAPAIWLSDSWAGPLVGAGGG